MSSETRAAVLQSVRFKPEHLSSEFFYVTLIAYVLFTRHMADINQYALPVFLVLVTGYQLAGLILQIVRRQLPDVWDVLYWTGGTVVFSVGYVLAMYGLIAIAIDAWSVLNTMWEKLDPLRDQNQFMAVTGLVTLSFGGIFFLFRLKQRFLYGLSEASVGVLVGMHRVTLEQWSGMPTSSGFYLALLTAGIYLVVRGLDNIYQASRDGDATLMRFASLISTRAFKTKVRRLPSSRVRRRRPRREQQTTERVDHLRFGRARRDAA